MIFLTHVKGKTPRVVGYQSTNFTLYTLARNQINKNMVEYAKLSSYNVHYSQKKINRRKGRFIFFNQK